MQVFVINLAHRADRRFAITEALGSINVSFHLVCGSDGATTDIKRHSRHLLTRLYGYYPERLPGSVGCFLSHRSLWQHIIDHNVEIALIVEDDAVVHDWDPRILDLDLASLGIDVLRIGISRRQLQKNRKSLLDEAAKSSLGCIGRKLVWHDKLKSGLAYVVTRSGAQKLLKCRRFWFPVDHYLVWRVLYDVKSYLLYPPAFVGNEIEVLSDIRGHQNAGSVGLYGRYFSMARRVRNPILRLISALKGISLD